MTSMRNEVDPRRFIGKQFKRRQAFQHAANDFSIIIDGLVAGRIMQKKRADQRVIWFWTMTAPYYPFKMHHGEEETYEAARDAFKAQFWEWHKWALKQTGMATWYGDD
jgi:hypothetical protein